MKVSNEHFIAFMNGGVLPEWYKEKAMSGCQPTGDFCNCDCHKKYGSIGYLAGCACGCGNNKNENRPIYSSTQEDASPMVKKIQELEIKLDNLIDLFNHYQEDNGSWKLGVKGDIVSLNQCYLELVERIKEIDDWKKGLMLISVMRFPDKKPHRCPICDGTSFCKEGMDCKACEGKGIVWG